jgi:hypothetical protein
MTKPRAPNDDEELEQADSDDARRQRQLEALERFFAGPKWDIANNGRMPTAEERNARPWPRRIGLPYDW